MNWRKVPLADLALSAKGSFVDGPFGSNLKASEYQPVGVPIIRLQNIRPNQFMSKDIKFIAPEKAADLSRHMYEPGDLVISKLGDPPACACVVPPSAGSGIVVADVVRFRSDPKVADHRYLSYFLNSPDGRRQFLSLSKGTTRTRVNLSSIKTIEISLPPTVGEQRQIAALLDKVDALRRLRQESFQLIERLRQSVFLDMFGNARTNPMGWPETTVGQILLDGPQNGLYQPQSDYGSGTRILRIDGFYDGVVVDEQKLKRLRVPLESEQLYLLREGDIVVNRVNSLEYLGKSAVVPRFSEPVVFESNIMRMGINRDRMVPQFLIALLQTAHIKRQITSRAKKAVNQASINQTDIKGLRVFEPPISLQEEYVNRIQLLRRFEKDAELQEVATTAFWSSLQQRAFRGELDLSRLVLDSQAEFLPNLAPGKVLSKDPELKTVSIFFQPLETTEVALVALDTLLHKDGPIPWSSDYFKYRILGGMPGSFTFGDVMERAYGVFSDTPPYEEIKDMFLELLGQGEGPVLLRQIFDLQIHPESNEVSGRKEIVFRPNA